MLETKIILLLIIFIYSKPLWFWRYQFRSKVYQEKGWKINFRPWFIKEVSALISNEYFHGKKEIRMANRYRVYLIGYALLWILFFRI